MVDWHSPTELQNQAAVFTKFMHALLGVYAWEWFISLDFDWAYISGKKQFKWPMIFYFANRYLLLFAMIGIAIALDSTSKLDCQTLYTFNQLAGDAAVGLASINLAIRTVAIWSQNRVIIGGLVLVVLGHWSLILQGVQLKATWVDGVGCVITETNNKILAAIFIYSMCFDLLILLVNTWKLLRPTSTAMGALGLSRLSKMIFEDGLIFFFIAFMANLIATVFMVLNLNQIMSVIFNVPAAVFNTIVACRAVRRLQNFAQNTSVVGSQITMSQGRGTAPRLQTKPAAKSAGGVHVQMETFTHAEDNFATDSKLGGGTREGSDTDVELDLEAAKRRAY